MRALRVLCRCRPAAAGGGAEDNGKGGLAEVGAFGNRMPMTAMRADNLVVLA
jgi:hypothetical protein